MPWAVKEFTKRRKGRDQKFCSLSKERKGLVRRDTPTANCRGFKFLLGDKGGGGWSWSSAVMSISCKSGGFGLIVQASVCFTVFFGVRVQASGLICLVY